MTDTAGRALPGVRVQVEGLDPFFEQYATTAADGTYRVGQLPGRTRVTLTFLPTDATQGRSALGYTARCWQNTPAPYGRCDPTGRVVTTKVGALQTGFDARLPAAGGISGRVIDVTGRGIPQVSVTVSGGVDGFQGTLSAADGTWSIAHLEPSQYHQVCVRFEIRGAWPDPDGYEDRYPNDCWHTPGDVDDRNVTVTGGAVTTGIDIVAVGKGGIGGAAVDASGAPLGGVGVVITGSDNSESIAQTAADGSFRIGYLSVGTYQVCFENYPYQYPDPQVPALGWVQQCSTVDVADNVTTAVPTATVVEGAAVTGTVTDVYGFTVDRVHVDVVNDVSGVTYDADTYDGRYRLDSIAPGRYTVCFDTSSALRHQDGRVPPHGYVDQCWKHVSVGGRATRVVLVGGQTSSGLDARLAAGHVA